MTDTQPVANVTDALSALKADAWANAWCNVLQRTDRIMSGQRVTVQVANAANMDVPGSIPSWTDGLNIFLSDDEIKSRLKQGDAVGAALRLKGLNYHELCHVLFTPRNDTQYAQSITRNEKSSGKWRYASNMLEDQRIETWFASMYGASRRYFEAIVMEWILQNGTAESAIALYGRKYLSPKIRIRVGNAFVARYGVALYEEFKSIIDAYLVLTLPGEDQKALSLVTRYRDLLLQLEALGATLPPLVIADNGGDGQNDPNGHSHAKAGSVSRQGAKDARNQAVSYIEDSLDADAEAEADMAAGGSAGGGGAGGGANPGGAGAGNAGTGPGQGWEDGQADGADGTDSGDTADGGGNGGSGAGTESAIKQMLEAAEEEVEDIAADEDVQADIENMLDSVKAAVQSNDVTMQTKPSTPHSKAVPSNAALLAVRGTHGVLSRIRMQAEPETLFKQTHGRADVRRIITRQPGDAELFRTYDSGREDETGVEAVILVDVSGSMHHNMAKASEALWSLKKSFDKLDIPCTILLWESRGSMTLAYKARDKAPGQVQYFGSGGGTNPAEALHQATRIFYKSSAANKALITITDGSWDSYEDYKTPMKALQKLNVSSMLLGLDDAVKHHGKHHHDFGHDLKTIGDLPKAATKLVAGLMARAENG